MVKNSFFGTFKQCSADLGPISCDFLLYTNATNLTSSQKLAPNTDITGRKVTYSFIIISFLAAAVGIMLILDEAHLLYCKRREQKTRSDKSFRDADFYRRLLHTLDSTLHGFSDLQLVSGLSVLFALFYQGCTVSAYHYNIVCLMLLMTLVTHTLAVVNIPKFFAKHGYTSILRFTGMVLTLGFSFVMFKSRDISNFPTTPSSLAILPGTCFANQENFTSMLSNVTSDFSNVTSDFNISDIFVAKDEADYQYRLLFLPIVITLVIGIMFFATASTSMLDTDDYEGNSIRDYAIWILRVIFTFISVIILIVATHQYVALRNGMEINEWFLVGKENAFAFAQIVSLAILASTSLGILKAINETIEGPRGKQRTITNGMAKQAAGDSLEILTGMHSLK